VIELKTSVKRLTSRLTGPFTYVVQDALAAHAYQQALHEYQPPNIERRAQEILESWLKGEK
jgi:hypothetical protein